MTVRTFLEGFSFPSRDKKSAMDPERVIASIVALLFLIIALRKVQRFFSSRGLRSRCENRYRKVLLDLYSSVGFQVRNSLVLSVVCQTSTVAVTHRPFTVVNGLFTSENSQIVCDQHFPG